jgi:putative hydrolase of the HAD superfamily
VLFDLDDTLIAYSDGGARAWDRFCREYAPQCGVDADQLWPVIRKHSLWFWDDPERHRRERVDMCEARRKILSLALDELGCQRVGMAEEMARYRSRLAVEMVELFPGAMEAVQRFKLAGVKLGMVTNGTAVEQWAKIDRFGLRELFDVVVVEGEFGRGKPDREVFDHALHSLGVEPGETWMVGDNLEMDIAPADQLGLHTVWHDWRGSGLTAEAKCRPHRIIRQISELSA